MLFSTFYLVKKFCFDYKGIMQENTKEDKKTEKKREKPPEKPSSSEDETPRNYYYDDACGYEVYTDEDEDEDEV